MNGLFLVDKPAGLTSHDVVARLRRALGGVKTGHFGTLDPLATGLLIVAVGQAPRLFAFHEGLDKSYEGRLRFGQATDTYDAEGEPVAPLSAVLPSPAEAEEAVLSFLGRQSQLPPLFSAKKHRGRPLYDYARKGAPAPPPAPCDIEIKEIRVLRYDPPDLDFSVSCSSGTYIRSLAHDIGRRLGCGAFLAALRRTAVGGFRIEAALPLDELVDRISAGRTGESLLPMEALLPGLPKAVLTADGSALIRDGRPVPLDFAPGFLEAAAGTAPGQDTPPGTAGAPPVRLFEDGGRMLGLARWDRAAGLLRPFLVFFPSGRS